MDKKTKIEDLPVDAEQAADVKGGWVSESSLIDPNNKSIIDPNDKTFTLLR